ncbi:MAG: hypothetical protein ACFE9A_21520 [Candidatus Hodarchaeota archaeon]
MSANLVQKWKELLGTLSIGDDFPYQSIKRRKKKRFFNTKAIGIKIIINEVQTEELPQENYRWNA